MIIVYYTDVYLSSDFPEIFIYFSACAFWRGLLFCLE
uniref:Uncharacterized protein n=1 Tax=Siphoviridae sp. ct7es18 TaxID=2826166 RepID=A0A8S5MH55_9CAUD|nr:MAG TPA: hypothetical protein [Siphoviridae sp. ct7es18]